MFSLNVWVLLLALFLAYIYYNSIPAAKNSIKSKKKKKKGKKKKEESEVQDEGNKSEKLEANEVPKSSTPLQKPEEEEEEETEEEIEYEKDAKEIFPGLKIKESPWASLQPASSNVSARDFPALSSSDAPTKHQEGNDMLPPQQSSQYARVIRVVSTPAKKKEPPRKPKDNQPEQLTKKQRENMRKKQREKEEKQLHEQEQQQRLEQFRLMQIKNMYGSK